jgi:large subunit ribosomal protein L9
MEVVLLERVEKLGQMGDVVRVKEGYARNFLLPQRKALRANEANLARFEQQRAELEARNLERRGEAEKVGERLEGEAFVLLRQAGESGQLYGSVSARDIAQAATDGGFAIERRQVVLEQPIKTVGLHPVRIALHPEVSIGIMINVARSEAEAERQASGEDAGPSEDELARIEAERFFQEGQASQDEDEDRELDA